MPEPSTTAFHALPDLGAIARRSAPEALAECWLKPQRLEYMPLDDHLAVVRLVAAVRGGFGAPARSALVVGRPDSILRSPALGSVTHRVPRRFRPADELLWRVTFALPLELVQYPQAIFGLVARGQMPARLPDPALATLQALCQPWPVGPRGADLLNSMAWRRVAALGTAIAVAGSSLSPAAALAAGHHSSGRSVALHRGPTVRSAPAAPAAHAALARPADPPAAPNPASHATAGRTAAHIHSVTSHPSSSARTGRLGPGHDLGGAVRHSSSGGASTRPASASPDSTASGHDAVPAARSASGSLSGRSTQPDPSRLAARSGASAHIPRHLEQLLVSARDGLSTLSPAPDISLKAAPASLARAVSAPAQTAQHHDHSASAGGGQGRAPARGAGPLGTAGGAAAKLRPNPPAPLPSAPPSPPASDDPDDSGTSTAAPGSTPAGNPWGTGVGSKAYQYQPPAFLIPIYKKAGARYHIPWTVLAAINSIESDYGRDLNTSSAGAEGWMQFMPATWAEYGMAINHPGAPNPYNPTDAIFSAAHYLAANGGSQHLRQAIFAYNHATWYVNEVLQRAHVIGLYFQGMRAIGGYALPLQPRYMQPLGRTDDGVDIENAPDGAPVYSMTPGVVTAVASDPNGFGPNYPVIHVTAGPLTGKNVYYGHVATALVKVGQRVKAGQPIAIMGHTGDAAGLGHGHIEIGFSTEYGDPLNHHGASAWTAAGAAMRRFLITLCGRYHINVS